MWLLSSVTLATRVRELNGYEMPEPVRAKEFAALVEKAIDVD